MRLRIHRGANEIGGNCVEIESWGHSILLDLGLPLTAEAVDPSLAGHPGAYGWVKSSPARHYLVAHPRGSLRSHRSRAPDHSRVHGRASTNHLARQPAFRPPESAFPNNQNLSQPAAVRSWSVPNYASTNSAKELFELVIQAALSRH